MQKITKIPLFFFFMLLLIGCNTEKKRFEKMLNVIHKQFEGEEKDFYVIIPNQGCGGCISYMEDFYVQHKNEKHIGFIFTNILSLKILNNKLDINLENTFVDKENIVMNYYPNDKKIYPCILEMDGKNIKNVYYQSPYEDGINKIR